MAATIQIHEMTTATAGVDRSAETVRFRATDSQAVDANNPLVIPVSGNAYSYTKKLRAFMLAKPVTSVCNLRWYSDGGNAFGTVVTVYVKNIGTTFGTQYTTAMTGGASFTNYTAAAPLDGDATDTGPFGTDREGSYIGDIIELQFWVSSAAEEMSLDAQT